MHDKYGYDYEYDPFYCYKESGVLKNKLGIEDPDALYTAEREITALWLLRLKTQPVKGSFDFTHLKRIHRKMFSDIYSWAGKSRTVDISKGNLFCRCVYIDVYAEELFKKLKDENYLIGTKKAALIGRLSYYFGEINALHPFREGNGRTQRLFIEYLGSVCGVHIDFSGVKPEDMAKASASAFAGGLVPLTDILERICSPVGRDEQEKNIAYFFGSRSVQLKRFKETDTK